MRFRLHWTTLSNANSLSSAPVIIWTIITSLFRLTRRQRNHGSDCGKAESLKLTVSKSKSRIVPLTKPFRYCKAKFILTETGRVVMNGNRDGVKRARRKIKAFRTKIQNGEMSYDDLWTSVNGMLAYFESYDDHKRVLRLRRLFYSIFGFSPERIENFRERGKKDEIRCA